MANLTFVTGVESGSDFVRVGHNSSAVNNDAVWSFTPTAAASDAVFVFKWNNSDAGTGWKGSFDYVFGISENGENGRLAESCSSKEIVTLSGDSGTAIVKFIGLSLKANTTYYIRANLNEDTKSTMKAFYQDGNTVTLTAKSANIVFNGEAVENVIYNGNEVTSLIYNGNTIF